MNAEGDNLSRPAVPLVYLLGILGGVAGILAAIYQEMQYGGWMLVVAVIAPAIEEVCKPIGVIFLLDKRPHWLRSSRQVVLTALLGAAVFATLENLLYIHVYHPSASMEFVIYRYTVCTAMHISASLVFGVGLARMWRHIRSQGGHFDIDVCFRNYVIAVVIHAVYNSAVLVLHWTGLLRFR